MCIRDRSQLDLRHQLEAKLFQQRALAFGVDGENDGVLFFGTTTPHSLLLPLLLPPPPRSFTSSSSDFPAFVYIITECVEYIPKRETKSVYFFLPPPDTKTRRLSDAFGLLPLLSPPPRWWSSSRGSLFTSWSSSSDFPAFAYYNIECVEYIQRERERKSEARKTVKTSSYSMIP